MSTTNGEQIYAVDIHGHLSMVSLVCGALGIYIFSAIHPYKMM